MVDLVYDAAAIVRVRGAVAAEARRIPALADTVPDGAALDGAALDGAVLGGLAGAGALGAALAELHGALHAELTAAGARLDVAGRTLDAALAAMRASDGRATRALSPP